MEYKEERTIMKGSLVNVGLGMTLGSHITPLSRNFIEQADVVFVAASNNLVEEWVGTMNDNVISLQSLYGVGKNRKQTYEEMAEAIMTEVRSGKKVCGAFYGHPGVFAWAPHETIRRARKEGFKAHMEPGISAEDCLYADLGLDPGTHGCNHYEASSFIYRKRPVDNSAYLVLWQISIVGEKTLTKFESTSELRQIFLDEITNYYDLDHEVILYECAVLPIEKASIKKIKLRDFVDSKMSLKTTMVIPPTKTAELNSELLKKLNQ